MAETTRQDTEIAGRLTAAELKAAADQASAAYDYEQAEALYTQALGLPGLPPQLAYDLLTGRAECHMRLGQADALAADSRAMVQLAEALQDAPRLIRAWLAQAESLSRQNQAPSALALAQQALAQARQ